MKTQEINLRDPFILTENNTYYLYGTRAETCWTAATGFDCYTSQDLENWEGPCEVFHKSQDFWADLNCWAPEVHVYNGSYYMFATFKNSTSFGGTAILKANSPLGPFTEHSARQITPKDWECIDGTFFVDSDGKPYMIFGHEWVQISDGAICAVELSRDLKEAVSEPFILFHASEAKAWIKTYESKNHPGKNYVCDGPFLHRLKTGELLLLWSSFGEEGYTESIAFSESGTIIGPWVQQDELLFKKDGGHGMVFTDLGGQLYLTLDSPNETLKERPAFYPLKEADRRLFLL